MGKRSNFERKPRDCYDTPMEAVLPLIPHMGLPAQVWEPCAGKGDLVRAINACTPRNVRMEWLTSDIEPRGEIDGYRIKKLDALSTDVDTKVRLGILAPSMIITNPPWSRPILHKMIDKFRRIAPTWLLIDSNWANTQQAVPYLKHCRKIVQIGRVKWEPGSKSKGKDDAAWYLFGDTPCETIFINTQTRAAPTKRK